MQRMDRIRIIFISLLALFLAADAGLIGYLLWPGTSREAHRQEEKQLQLTLAQLRTQVTPLRGIEKKLVDTRANIKKFYDNRVPAYESEISSEIHKLEQETGVSQGSVHYAADNSGLPNVDRIKLDFAVLGDYPKLARFINALERDKWLFVINQVSLTGGQGQNAGTVQLQIRCETFLKGAA